MWLKCSLCSKNCFFSLTPRCFLRAPDNSKLFRFPLKVRVIGSQLYRWNTKIRSTMLCLWFWTIFSLGAPGLWNPKIRDNRLARIFLQVGMGRVTSKRLTVLTGIIIKTPRLEVEKFNVNGTRWKNTLVSKLLKRKNVI